MALTPEQTTRVDQLHADLRRVAKCHAGKCPPPNEAPMFIRHADGTVWDRYGRQVYAPPQQSSNS